MESDGKSKLYSGEDFGFHRLCNCCYKVKNGMLFNVLPMLLKAIKINYFTLAH